MGDEPGWTGPLPDVVRRRLLAHASVTLGALEDDAVPLPLRRYRGWAPARRERLAATPLAVTLERDVVFRQLVGARLREEQGELAEAVESGIEVAAADPVAVAVAAYLLRPPGWAAYVATAEEAAVRAEVAAREARSGAELARLEAELADARATARDEVAQLRREIAAVAKEKSALQRELRTEKGARRRVERAAAEAVDAARAAQVAAEGSVEAGRVELRRARSRQAEAEQALTGVRATAREARQLSDVRLRLLLDTLVEAAAGLRRELALPPVEGRPADGVASWEPDGPGVGAVAGAGRALLPEDPAVLDHLLSLPQVHLVVDGYNVTKTGYPDLSLEDQRARLVAGLGALAARSGAEVTCCFDGAVVLGRVPAPAARGVRVLFSDPDELADDLVRRLVRAEPRGRPVVVVSSDREVADSVRAAGARPVAAVALVRRLDRG